MRSPQLDRPRTPSLTNFAATPGGIQRRSSDNSIVSLIIVFLASAITVLVVLPLIITTSPTALNVGAPLSPPNLDHLLGTDQLGRDVLSRVIYGARVSILVAFASASVALVLGGILGAAAVAGPRWLREPIMRIIDVGLAFPDILLAVVLAAAIGPSLTTTIIALGITFTPSMARVIRAAVYSEYGQDYVTAARLLGDRSFRIVAYHVGANIILHVMVYMTLIMAAGILGEAALSFLGAGVRPPTPSWGNIIRDGQTVIHTGAWWIALFPGIAIVLTVLALNRLAETIGIRLRS